MTRPAYKHAESGAALLLVMVILLALSLAGISAMYLARSDTEVAGNIRVQDQALHAAEAAIPAAQTWLDQQSAPPETSSLNAAGFYSTYIPGYPTSQKVRSDILWTADDQTMQMSTGGFTVRYIIEAMCLSASNCFNENGASNSLSIGREYATRESGIARSYRVTIRAEGPRNTVALIQTVLNKQF